jgi:hypothetical protein
MSELKRHVGKINNTGSRVMVVFRKIPDDSQFCLVVEMDRLPDSYHQNLTTIVNSNEAQDTVDLYDVLSRRTFGNGNNCLNTLHAEGLLRKMEVSQVTLYPLPGVALPLADANRAIDGVTEVAPNKVTAPEQVLGLSPKEQAASMLNQAIELEEQVDQLRESAYVLCPELRPNKGRPKLSEEEAEEARQRRNAKRREKYLTTKA